MPGGNQLSGWWECRRARLVRLLSAALCAGAVWLLSATPAHAQVTLPDPSPLVTIAQGLIHTVQVSAGDITAPVQSVVPPAVQEVLGVAVTLDGTAPPNPETEDTAPVEAPSPNNQTMRAGRLAPTGTTAFVELARSSTALLLLALAAAVFLSFETVLARRNPRLTVAPVDRREAELEFR